MVETDYLEIEHKFIVDASQDPAIFHERIKGLSYQRYSQVEVADTYFLVEKNPGYIYRHRYDSELQQLTVKSLTDDPEVRLEVNLDLGHHCGSQRLSVEAFLKPLGIVWRGTLAKEVYAYYFADCEVVYYKAHYQNKLVACIEIEARKAKSIEEAKQVLARYEQSLDLDPALRSDQSLFHLLLKPHIPTDVLAHLATT